MIRRLLKARQLQHGIAHLAQAEAGDTQDLALVGHDVGEEARVAGIDVHGAHDGVDFVEDAAARGFDAEDVAGFDDAVGARGEGVDA